MDFRTIIKAQKARLEIDHAHSIFLTGSCFSENIGQAFNRHKFDVLINPFGISYNPISIHQSLFPMENLEWIEDKGVFFNYMLHSELNSLSKNASQLEYEKRLELQSKFLSKSHTIFITYGTAWVFELIANGALVNNCHKQPSNLFNKRLLSQEEIVTSWKSTHRLLIEQYHKAFNIVFTLSPVRHLKNGFHENQLSKAVLLLAIEEICSTHENCTYFPSYEIVMDDLRDYRFYESNLTHPNILAIEYIWQHLADTYFTSHTKQLNERIQKLKRATEHKAFNPAVEQHQSFLKNLYAEIALFEEETKIDFSSEKQELEQQIIKE